MCSKEVAGTTGLTRFYASPDHDVTYWPRHIGTSRRAYSTFSLLNQNATSLNVRDHCVGAFLRNFNFGPPRIRYGA